MRISDMFRFNQPVISFEFFPPKSDEGVGSLFSNLERLAELSPSFVSVTYGAGGSTRAMTVELVTRIKRELGIETMAHVTCVGHSADDICRVLGQLQDGGIENVLALRGDPPRGEERFERPSDGFEYAQELVRYIRPRYAFCLGGACYPEGHPESADRELDLRHLVEKVSAGVDILITQLFFDPDCYFDFVRRARAAGITQPILPGVMPVTNVAQIERFTSMCGATIPSELRARLDAVGDDEEAVLDAGVAWAADQCRTLLAGGAPGIHFYTLNRSLATRRIFESLRGQVDQLRSSRS